MLSPRKFRVMNKKINSPSSSELSENEISTQGQIQNEKKKNPTFHINPITPGIFNNCYCFFVAAELTEGSFLFKLTFVP